MKQLLLFCGWMAYSLIGYAQSNILVTNDEADSILKGLYNPADYIPDNVINSPFDIVDGIISGISPDSLKSHLEVLSTFGNRNTGADTISTTKGMGAARRWAFAKFQAFSENAENRLIPSYLQFDEEVCGMERHRNTFSILPGVGPQFDEVIIISGHLDSRCTDPCDITCEAVGMEDNGSGSVLVLELARVLSSFTFYRTIVFLLTTGEEQGLFGATAFAEYCEQQGIKVAAVLNNDTVGGIICGATASPPGCPGLGAIDSTNIRIYSAGTNTSPHKGLARFIKLEYEENVLPFVPTPNVINIMTSEDRVGRGGDHIPFRQRGFSAVRFTTAHEHGDGNPSQDGYTDRQHTINDVLGLDTDNDGVLDSFFVDFNYLARNTIINANAAAMAALGPITPLDVEFEDVDTGIQFAIDDPNDYGTYRIGWYGFNQNEFDTLITVNTISDTIVGLPSGPYFIS
ncbi:MAG: M28 family peptidase, partial [Bacteroidota bacterium]